MTGERKAKRGRSEMRGNSIERRQVSAKEGVPSLNATTNGKSVSTAMKERENRRERKGLIPVIIASATAEAPKGGVARFSARQTRQDFLRRHKVPRQTGRLSSRVNSTHEGKGEVRGLTTQPSVDRPAQERES